LFGTSGTPGGTGAFAGDVVFGVEGCAPTTNTTVAATAADDAIRFEITDRPTCKDPGGTAREFDRTLTLSVRRVQ